MILIKKNPILLNSILKSIEKNYEKTAIISSKSSITYKQLLIKANCLSSKISKKNPRLIGLFIKDPIQFSICYLATLIAGRDLLLLSNKMKLSELNKSLKYSNTELLITDDDSLTPRAVITNLLNTNKLEEHEFPCINQTTSYCYKNRNITNVLIQTSGTTGEPKIIKLSQKALLWNAKTHNELLNLKRDNTTLIIQPLTSSSAHTTQFLSQLIIGGTSYVTNSPMLPKDLYKIIEEYKINIMSCVPTYIKLINRFPPRSNDTSTLKYMLCVGDHIPLKFINQIKCYFPNCNFLRGYGLSEASPRITCTNPLQQLNDESSGKPLRGVDIKIVKDGNKTCGFYEKGEIWVKTPGLFEGYLNNSAATDEVMDKLWLKTGDIGCLDNELNLFVEGRKKNAINVGGFLVQPEEIEGLLVSDLKYVEDACAYPIEDELLGQKIVVDIKLIKKDIAINKEDIIKHLKRNLSDYKIPSGINIVSAIPRNRNGKISRMEV